jgi:myosin tail region-interacting protein MTI1
VPPKSPTARPKQGCLTWKPALPSPTEKTDEGSEEKKTFSSAGMSVSDMKGSIRFGGGGLKERMAVLQGLGAFREGTPTVPPLPGPK